MALSPLQHSARHPYRNDIMNFKRSRKNSSVYSNRLPIEILQLTQEQTKRISFKIGDMGQEVELDEIKKRKLFSYAEEEKELRTIDMENELINDIISIDHIEGLLM